MSVFGVCVGLRSVTVSGRAENDEKTKNLTRIMILHRVSGVPHYMLMRAC